MMQVVNIDEVLEAIFAVEIHFAGNSLSLPTELMNILVGIKEARKVNTRIPIVLSLTEIGILNRYQVPLNLISLRLSYL